MKWRAAVDRTVAPFGLTHAQYVLLATLYGLSLSGARPKQRDLAEATGLEPVYVSRLARALEEGGLITRAESSTDPRAVELSLTGRGQAAVTQAVAAVRELHAELLAPIGGGESRDTQQFRASLRALLREPAQGDTQS
jgi:MarR family transcriptional regulator, organic hydroperoxide resistance regulator